MRMETFFVLPAPSILQKFRYCKGFDSFPPAASQFSGKIGGNVSTTDVGIINLWRLGGASVPDS
jgi:hypothetical protein